MDIGMNLGKKWDGHDALLESMFLKKFLSPFWISRKKRSVKIRRRKKFIKHY